jgi:hypothetical protein
LHLVFMCANNVSLYWPTLQLYNRWMQVLVFVFIEVHFDWSYSRQCSAKNLSSKSSSGEPFCETEKLLYCGDICTTMQISTSVFVLGLTDLLVAEIATTPPCSHQLVLFHCKIYTVTSSIFAISMCSGHSHLLPFEGIFSLCMSMEADL